MIICHPCKKVMRCVTTGSHHHFQNGHAYVGDTFVCDACGNQTAVCNSRPSDIPEAERLVLKEKLGEYFVEMREGS